MQDLNLMATIDEKSQIAVLQTQMSTVIQGVRDINKKLDDQSLVYVTRGEFDEFKKRWVFSHVVVGLVASIMTGLIVYFITQGVK
jgi:hypothetical protein